MHTNKHSMALSLLEVGKMLPSKLAQCSNDTALRDIQESKAREIFIRNPGSGRSTSYRLSDAII